MNLDRYCLSRAITRIELLVILAILAAIAVPVGRVVFADDLHAFDEALFRRLGIDPGVGRFAIAVVVLVALVSWGVYRAIERRRQVRIQKQPFLRIPMQRKAPKT